MNTNLPTSAVLDLAADAVQSRGWTSGPDGWLRSGPVCLEGAIMAALGGVGTAELRACPAYGAVQRYLGLDDVEGSIRSSLWAWNDALPGSVEYAQARVIEVLRAAAAVERVREHTDAQHRTFAHATPTR